VATAKTAKIKPTRESVSPAPGAGAGLLSINAFDGTRQQVKPDTQILLTIVDGAQNQLFRDYRNGPSITFQLPVHNNQLDHYSIIAYANGSEHSGYQPVVISPAAPQSLDLMLLPKESTYHFAGAQWADLEAKKPLVARIFAASLADNAGAAYSQLMEDHPDHLACLLNITTAMEQINLPHGTPLDYFKQFDLPALMPDRIFGYADAKLVDEVRLAAQQGQFETEPAIDLGMHGDATSSYKQIQFGEANVQLTFHEKTRKTIDGVDCVYVEPDIDYYKDPGAIWCWK
jgi:hypothetical protein